MKKLIALLLAVSSMAMSTSALAFSVSPVASGEGASRNYLAGNAHVDGSDSFVEGASSSKQYLPTYRNGDEITLKIEGTDVVPDATLTFICSKLDDTDYTNYNVQMVDQITIDSTSVYTCTYKLRKSLTDGLYKLEMRLGTETKTFSFLIGTPSVELLYVNDVTGKTPTVADKYYLKHGDAYCFGKATITGGANFSQVDTDFGFVFGGTYRDEYIKKTDMNSLTVDANNALQASITNNGNQEIGGTANYFFRTVIEDVYEYTVHGSELTAEQAAAVYATLPDVDVWLND